MTNKSVDHGIIFKEIKFRNFMSFGNLWTTVDLESTGTTLIIGENLDCGISSGAGKSTLINALSYCLYDKIPATVSKDKLINQTNDKKSTQMEVHTIFKKGNDNYLLKRWRGGTTGCQLIMNEVDITPASVNRGEDSFNAKIEEILGFSYNLFSQIILFNGNSKPFLDLPVGEQRLLIEELFRITMLSNKAGVLKKIISDTEKTIGLNKLLIDQQKKQNEIHTRHINDAEDRISKWNKSRDDELHKISESLNLLSSIDFESEEICFKKISDIKIEIEIEQNKILSEQKIHNSKMSELMVKRGSIERETTTDTSELTITNNDLKKQKSEYESIKNELIHLNDSKCPYCLQQLSDTKDKILNLELRNSSLTNNITSQEEKITRLKDSILTFNEVKKNELTKIDDIISDIKKIEIISVNDVLLEKTTLLNKLKSSLTFKDINSLFVSNNEISSLSKRLEDMEQEVNPHIDARDSLIKEGEVEIDIKSFDELNILQNHQQFLLKLLTDKNSFIRKNIISKTIPFLNKRIAYYTEKLNLPHIVLFKPDMSCEISQLGRDLDHGNLSNGEKKKLNLSLCLSFRDVLTYLHSKVNILFTDEVDGGSISGHDVDSLISMIKSKSWDDAISIFIISHRPEFEGRCDNNIIVRKENGFSSLILQPDE